MKAFIQFVNLPSLESPGTTVLLHFDKKRYLFGHVAEATQRIAVCRKVRLSRVSDIFLTGTIDWRRVGGLPGLMLTMADAGVTEMTAHHGGRNLSYALACTRHFIFRQSLKLQTNEFRDEFRDDFIKVTPISILPRHKDITWPSSRKRSRSPECGEKSLSEATEMVRNMFGSEDEKPTATRWLPPSTPDTTSICYLVRLHAQRGKFLPQKAMALGVRPGKDFSRLVKGETIHLENGSQVLPELCMEPTRPGASFALLDIPSEEYITSVIVNNRINAENVDCTIYILGSGVIDNPRFREWFEQRPGKHIVSRAKEGDSEVVFDNAAAISSKLHAIASDIFPLPFHRPSPPSVETSSFTLAKPMLTLQLAPLLEIQQPTDTDPQRSRTLSLPSGTEDVISHTSDDVSICTLGTGSALPSKYRNVSSTLVVFPKATSVLLDCGESTLGQLTRTYGQEVDRVLSNIGVIYISHLHADHHLGTIEVMRRILQLRDGLVLVGPPRFQEFIRELACIDAFGIDRIQFVSCSVGRTDEIKDVLDIGVSMRTCFVNHCPFAYGVSIAAGGCKVVYSGDTRPCEALVSLGQNASLLIHEATFASDLVEEALAKKHSTTQEAMEIGRRMNAERILLTHFSQRYPKLPKQESNNVVVAFDGMVIRLGQFQRFHSLLPALEKVFHEETALHDEVI